jgi:REP element-mobilizing transposase RayT
MPQAFASVYVHLIFTTQGRQPFLTEAALRKEVHRFLGAISKSVGCFPISVGGTEDHVHVLAGLSRTMTIAEWVRELKRSSSVWIKSHGVTDFAWQSGFAVFSVSIDQLAQVTESIESQESKHAATGFKDEFMALLKQHGQVWDEKHAWD